jgi:hypothetical protein
MPADLSIGSQCNRIEWDDTEPSPTLRLKICSDVTSPSLFAESNRKLSVVRKGISLAHDWQNQRFHVRAFQPGAVFLHLARYSVP